MTNVINALLLLVSGIYFPIAVLPGWMQTISRLSPAYYVLDGMRGALLEGASVLDLAVPALLPLVVIGVLSVPLGLWIFLTADRYAKRTGKLKRNG